MRYRYRLVLMAILVVAVAAQADNHNKKHDKREPHRIERRMPVHKQIREHDKRVQKHDKMVREHDKMIRKHDERMIKWHKKQAKNIRKMQKRYRKGMKYGPGYYYTPGYVQISLNNGINITYDDYGNWRYINSIYNAPVPVELIPVPVYRQARKHFPNSFIINLTNEGGWYNVSLANGQKVRINLQGNIEY